MYAQEQDSSDTLEAYILSSIQQCHSLFLMHGIQEMVDALETGKDALLLKVQEQSAQT